MREIKVVGRTFKIRSLTYGETKELRKQGYGAAELKRETADAAMDAYFRLVFTQEEIGRIETYDHLDAVELFKGIMAETYGSRDEEKNLSASGNGSQTPSE